MMINEQVGTAIVPNPITHLPSFSTDDLINIMRIDKTKGIPRIAYYIEHAYDVINGQIPGKFFSESGWQSAQACLINNVGQLPRAYKRAVMHEAAALMADDNIDYDSTGAGSATAEDMTLKSDRLRRIVNHAVADMTSRRRNRVKLL